VQDTARSQKEIGAMENKPAQNIQDSFLNTARKEKTIITIYLLSGVKLTGRIRSFDKYSVVLETGNQEQLIFKHAISTVVMAKGMHLGENKPARGPLGPQHTEPKPAQNATPPAAPASSSGTEG
jgi:host factor-I protein